jgi:hypothetical protein
LLLAALETFVKDDGRNRNNWDKQKHQREYEANSC